ncbi:MAG: hypothetical protein JNJ46_09830 [Myxococcales bacterium]|nr:hypothetical protein [Myxococcales bacterium]
MIGSSVGGYQIVRLIGQGGMGAVYEALQVKIGRRAALKVLLPELADDKEHVARFFNETSRLIFRRDLAGLGGPGNGQGMADLGGEAASLSLEHRARLAGSQYR